MGETKPVRRSVDRPEQKAQPLVATPGWAWKGTVQSSPYLSTSGRDFQEQEQARRQANERYVRGFKSYREAELHGYYSLKRLREMGLSVPDWMRPYYECAVETQYGRYPVYPRARTRLWAAA